MQSVVLGLGFVTAPLLSSAKYTFPIDPYSIIYHSADQQYGQKRWPFKEAQFFSTARIKNEDGLPLMNNSCSEQQH
jgi:hypothetical protein